MDFVKCIFTILLQTQHEVIFYLLVNTSKPKFVALLVFVCTTASFTCPQVRLRTLSEQQLFDGCGAQLLKFDVSNAEGSICQFLNPCFFFFSGVQKVGYRYFFLKVSFLFVFLGTVPKGLARGIFLTQQGRKLGLSKRLGRVTFPFGQGKMWSQLSEWTTEL